ncbi:MAG: cytochrome oxidase subunit III [Dehalococcoidia bacterium]|nr:cytochrome oxidase subunit III [Dehalococcoidia bacterium]
MEHAAAHTGVSSLRFHRVGLWLFILSESFLFAAFLSARYYLVGVERPPELNQLLGLAITCILILSSVTAFRAEMFMRHGQVAGLLRNTGATILLGGLFVIGVGWEWAEALTHFPPSSPFGTLFFSLTGLHALHVLSGLALLILVYWNGRRGGYTPEQMWGVEGSVKYWHFVDVAWVIIYPTLYLVA